MAKHTAPASADRTTRPPNDYQPRHDADNPIEHRTGTTRRDLVAQAIRNGRRS